MTAVRNILLMFLVGILLGSCGKTPQGGASYVVSHNEEGRVTAVFAQRERNGQYCIYSKDFPAEMLVWQDELRSSDLIAAEDGGECELLTPRSVAKTDLVQASLNETVDVGYALNIGAYAVFPAATLCIASTALWLVMNKKLLLKRAVLLSCGGSVSLLGIAKFFAHNGEKETTAGVETLLADKFSHAGRTFPKTRKVLKWLASENSVPCPAEPRAVVEQ